MKRFITGNNLNSLCQDPFVCIVVTLIGLAHVSRVIYNVFIYSHWIYIVIRINNFHFYSLESICLVHSIFVFFTDIYYFKNLVDILSSPFVFSSLFISIQLLKLILYNIVTFVFGKFIITNQQINPRYTFKKIPKVFI